MNSGWTAARAKCPRTDGSRCRSIGDTRPKHGAPTPGERLGRSPPWPKSWGDDPPSRPTGILLRQVFFEIVKWINFCT